MHCPTARTWPVGTTPPEGRLVPEARLRELKERAALRMPNATDWTAYKYETEVLATVAINVLSLHPTVFHSGCGTSSADKPCATRASIIRGLTDGWHAW